MNMDGYTIDPYTWEPTRYHATTTWYHGKKWATVRTDTGSRWTVVWSSFPLGPTTLHIKGPSGRVLDQKQGAPVGALAISRGRTPLGYSETPILSKRSHQRKHQDGTDRKGK